MIKRDLVMRIAKETGIIQQDIAVIIDKTIKYITEALVNGDSVMLKGFGCFEIRKKKARVGYNFHRPLEKVQIPERKFVKFVMGSEMKKLIVNGENG